MFHRIEIFCKLTVVLDLWDFANKAQQSLEISSDELISASLDQPYNARYMNRFYVQGVAENMSP